MALASRTVRTHEGRACDGSVRATSAAVECGRRGRRARLRTGAAMATHARPKRLPRELCVPCQQRAVTRAHSCGLRVGENAEATHDLLWRALCARCPGDSMAAPAPLRESSCVARPSAPRLTRPRGRCWGRLHLATWRRDLRGCAASVPRSNDDALGLLLRRRPGPAWSRPVPTPSGGNRLAQRLLLRPLDISPLHGWTACIPSWPRCVLLHLVVHRRLLFWCGSSRSPNPHLYCSCRCRRSPSLRSRVLHLAAHHR